HGGLNACLRPVVRHHAPTTSGGREPLSPNLAREVAGDLLHEDQKHATDQSPERRPRTSRAFEVVGARHPRDRGDRWHHRTSTTRPDPAEAATSEHAYAGAPHLTARSR